MTAPNRRWLQRMQSKWNGATRRLQEVSGTLKIYPMLLCCVSARNRVGCRLPLSTILQFPHWPKSFGGLCLSPTSGFLRDLSPQEIPPHHAIKNQRVSKNQPAREQVSIHA